MKLHNFFKKKNSVIILIFGFIQKYNNNHEININDKHSSITYFNFLNWQFGRPKSIHKTPCS